METALKQQAESYLGTAIQPSEWDNAKPQAERKLKWIIDREGDADGARREPWYLAQLIAEAVQGSRLSAFSYALMEAIREAEEFGAKKEQPTS